MIAERPRVCVPVLVDRGRDDLHLEFAAALDAPEDVQLRAVPVTGEGHGYSDVAFRRRCTAASSRTGRGSIAAIPTMPIKNACAHGRSRS